MASSATGSKIMSGSDELLFRSLGWLISLVGAYWVWRDSKRLSTSGVSVTPPIWTILVFLSWYVSLPAYLVLRRWYWQKQVGEAGDELLRQIKTSSEGYEYATIPESEGVCSEAAIRALAAELRDLPGAEAWEKMRAHYNENACADVLDVDRFEDILIEALEQRQR